MTLRGHIAEQGAPVLENAALDEALIPNEPIESSRGRTLDRVLAALRGQFDANLLDDDESSIFMDLFAEYLARPNQESDEFVAKMRAEGDYFGEDGEGRLVQVLPGGRILVIDAHDR